MNNLKRKLLVLLLGLITGVLIGEVALHLMWQEPEEEINEQFKYNYLDIYEKVFRRKKVSDKYVYESVRKLMSKQIFIDPKKDLTKRIFIIGESTAQGFDLKILEDELKRVLPKFDFEIVNCGMGAYDAYRTRLIGEEIINYDPDLVIVIVGNSEFLTTRKVNRFRYQGLLSRSKIFRIITDNINPSVNIDNLPDANRYYKENLRKLFEKIKQKDIGAILCTLPVNYRYYNCTSNVELKHLVFNMLYRHFNDHSMAKKLLETLKDNKELESYIYYESGKLSDKKNQYERAYNFYRKELNSFEYTFTCPPDRNDLIRSIAKDEKIVLADIQKKFVHVAPNGLPGFDLFKDNCHVWPSAYRIYTEAIIEAVYNYNRSNKSNILASLADWQIGTMAATDYDKLSKKITEDKNGSEYRLFVLSVFKILNGVGPISIEGIDLIKQIYHINDNYFDNILSAKQSVQEELRKMIWSRVSQINPESNELWSEIYCHIGIALMQLDKKNEAIENLNESIRLNKKSFIPYVFRGILHHMANEKEQAINDFNTAAKQNSNFSWSAELTQYLDTKI